MTATEIFTAVDLIECVKKEHREAILNEKFVPLSHIKEFIEKTQDPEVIAKFGKTQEQRMAINTFIRDANKFLLNGGKQ